MANLKLEELKNLSYFHVHDKFERDGTAYFQGEFLPPYTRACESGNFYVLEPDSNQHDVGFHILWTAPGRSTAILEVQHAEDATGVAVGASYPCSTLDLRRLLLVIDLDTAWQKRAFTASDAWSYESSPGWRTTLSPGEVPPNDSKGVEKLTKGWDHEHCAFCWATIAESPEATKARDAETTGYLAINVYGNEEWVCRECYETKIVPHTLAWLVPPPPQALIKALIARDIGNDRSHTNSHGCNLRHCLVEPVKRAYKNSFKEGEILNVWLVLEEFPENPTNGYGIIFDEEENQFGLVSDGIFIGYYGSFLATFDAM